MTKKEWDQLVDGEPEKAHALVLEKVLCWPPNTLRYPLDSVFLYWHAMECVISVMEERGFDWLVAPDEAYFSKGQFFYQSDYQFGSEFRSDISRPRAVATAAMIALGEVEPEESREDKQEETVDEISCTESK